MRKWLSMVLTLVMLFSSVPVFAQESYKVSELNLNDNTIIVGDYAFDLDETTANGLSLENFIKAAQTAYEIDGDYEVYYRMLGAWYNMIADENMTLPLDASEINGDGEISFINMEQARPLDYVYESPEEIAYKLTDVTLEGLTGSEASGYKLGFLKPENMDDVSAYCIVWSTSDFATVHEALIGMSRDEINDMAEENSDNQAYIITNLGWADGIGNTYNSGQNDVINGREFSWPGVHHFYALTLSDTEVLAVTEAEKHADSAYGPTVDIKPAPLSVELTGQGANLSDYSVSIEPFTEDTRVEKDLIFVSELGFDSVFASFKDLSIEELNGLAEDGRAILRDTSGSNADLSDLLALYEGESFGDGAYYVYAGHVGSEGVLGLSKSLEMIVTAAPLSAPTSNGDGPGKGIVMAAGGGVSDGNEAFFDALRIEGEGTRVAIINTSHGNEATIYNYFYIGDDQYPDLKGRYDDLGFEAVYIPLGIDNYMHINNHEYFASLVESCDAVYLQGGDQAKHAKALLEDDGSTTLVAEAIRAVYERGGVVAGTSAGSHVLSNLMFGWGTPGQVMLLDGTEERALDEYDPSVGEFFPSVDGNNMSMPGLGLVPDEALTDTHFDARGRLGRLVQGLYDTGKTIGIGSDEGTALAIQDGVGTVVGLRGVTIVDMSEVEYSNDAYPEFRNVIVHYLAEGDSYDFLTGKVESVRELVEDYAGDVYETNDVFSAGSEYEVTSVLASLVNSSDDISYNYAKIKTPSTYENDVEMAVDFYWGDDTVTYMGSEAFLDEDGDETPGLEGLTKFTVDSMYMDIIVSEISEDESVAFEIESINLKADSDYTQYIILSEEIDPVTCVSGSSITVNAGQALYDDDFYSDSYANEIRISLEYPRTEGDTITLDGILSSEGEPLPKQTWVFDGTQWVNKLRVTEIPLKSGSDYTQYIVLSGDVDPSTLIADETIIVLGNSLYDEDFFDPDYANEIRISLYDARAEGNAIVLEGIEDADGNVISKEIWEFDGSDWIKK